MKITKLLVFVLALLGATLSLRSQEPPTIKLTTSRSVGDTIVLTMSFGEGVVPVVEGVEAYEPLASKMPKTFKLTSSTVLVKGDVSEVFCPNNNITSIDISKAPKLLGLVCHTNDLTSLDTSHNPDLGILVCEGNKLTKLNLTKNKNLVWLDCGNNLLTELDVTQNEALDLLYIGGNKFPSLIDISQNKNITSFSCFGLGLERLDISHLTNLAELHCFSNKISSLDLSKNTKLNSLICFDNKLTELDLTNNTQMYNVFCFMNNINGAGMAKLVSTAPTINPETALMNFFIVVNSLYEQEGNVCSTDEVATLRGKNWEVLDIRANPDSVLSDQADPQPYMGVLGIEDIHRVDKSLVVTPNPASDFATIVGAAGQVLLFDANGRLLKTQTATPDLPLQIDVRHQPAGVYFLINGAKVARLIVKK